MYENITADMIGYRNIAGLPNPLMDWPLGQDMQDITTFDMINVSIIARARVVAS